MHRGILRGIVAFLVAFSSSRQVAQASSLPPRALALFPGHRTWSAHGSKERALGWAFRDLSQSTWSLMCMLCACHSMSWASVTTSVKWEPKYLPSQPPFFQCPLPPYVYHAGTADGQLSQLEPSRLAIIIC